MVDRPAYLRPRASTGPFPDRGARTIAQFDRDAERTVFAQLPPFLRRMIIGAGDRS